MVQRHLPGEEDLRAIAARGEISGIETAALARNDGVRLTRIEQHHRTAHQRYAQALVRKMQVLPPVLTQEQIAERHATVQGAIVVVAGTPAGHQRHVTGTRQVRQAQGLRPRGHRSHAAPVVGPAGARPGQRQRLHLTGLELQAR